VRHGARRHRQGDDLPLRPRHRQENSAIRQEVLAGLTPALTIIIAGIYDPAWLLEIEAIAAR
jgi:hypothetical protein